MSEPAPVVSEPQPDPQPRLKRARRIEAMICYIPSLIVLISAFVPLVRKPDPDDYDWLPMINYGFLHGLAWGRDIVFTYGPWGFVWNGYDPQTFPILCLFWTLAAAISWWVMWRMVRDRFAGSVLIQGFILFLLAIAMGGDYVCAPDGRLMVFPGLLLLYHFFFRPGPTDPAKLALVALVSFCGLVKFPYLVTGVIVLVVIGLDPIGARLKRGIPIAVYFFTFILGWLMAGQHLSDLPAHLRWSIELTRSYGEAMAMWTPNELRSVEYYLVACVLLLVAASITALRVLRGRGLLFIAALLILLLITFRSGFVRHDWHEIIATEFMMVVAMLAAVSAWPAMRGWGWRIIWTTCIVCTVLVESNCLGGPWHNSSITQQFTMTMTGVAIEGGELFRILTGKPSTQFASWDRFMANVAATYPLPPVHGTADLFPKDAVILLANRIDYSPRPTLQSYVAQTPALSRLNAAKFSGPDAPENIFLAIDLSTLNLPTVNDPLTWLEMLSRYRLSWMGDRYLLLVKRDVPRIPKLRLLSEEDAGFNQEIHILRNPSAVPGQLIWAQIEFQRRPLGMALAKLYKAPEIAIVTLPNIGESLAARLCPENASSGFLLGPLISATKIVGLLEAPDPDPASWEPMMPKAFMITGIPGSDPSWYFENTMHVKLYALTFETAH